MLWKENHCGKTNQSKRNSKKKQQNASKLKYTILMLCILANKIKDLCKSTMFVDLSFSNTDENWSAYTEHIKCSTVVLYK